MSPVKRMKAGPLTATDPDSTSTPATYVCLEPVVELVRRLGGLGVSLIAGAVIVFVLGVGASAIL